MSCIRCVKCSLHCFIAAQWPAVCQMAHWCPTDTANPCRVLRCFHGSPLIHVTDERFLSQISEKWLKKWFIHRNKRSCSAAFVVMNDQQPGRCRSKCDQPRLRRLGKCAVFGLGFSIVPNVYFRFVDALRDTQQRNHIFSQFQAKLPGALKRDLALNCIIFSSNLGWHTSGINP